MAVKTGETATVRRILQDGNGDPMDLTGATVVAYSDIAGPVNVTIDDPTDGVVELPRDLAALTVDDGDVARRDIEYLVTFADGTTQRVPSDGYAAEVVWRGLDVPLLPAPGTADDYVLASTFTSHDASRHVDIDPRAHGAVGDGATDDTAAIQAAIDAAHTAGGGAVRFPPGTYNVTTLDLKQKLCTLIGAGSRDCIIKSTNQTGPVPVLDMDGWKGRVNQATGYVEFGGFQVVGDGTPGAAGIYLGDVDATRFRDMGVSGTGGPAIEAHNGTLNLFEAVVVGRPTNADVNDVPYFKATGFFNGNTFVAVGFRSVTSDPDGSAVLFLDDDGSFVPDSNYLLKVWFEFCHTPEGGAIIEMGGGRNYMRPRFWDCSSAVDNPTGNAFVRMRPPTNVVALGGNHFDGLVPGRTAVAASIAYGVILDQSRNRVTGVREWKSHNVLLPPGTTNSYVELGGSNSGPAAAAAVEDNSGSTTNVIVDATAQTIRGFGRVGGSAGQLICEDDFRVDGQAGFNGQAPNTPTLPAAGTVTADDLRQALIDLGLAQ